MWALKATLLGGVAAGVLAYVFAAAAALVVAGTGGELDVALGPLGLVVVTTDGDTTTTTFGAGLGVIAAIGAVANLLGAVVIRRRRDRATIA